jgi:hypothetical protein
VSPYSLVAHSWKEETAEKRMEKLRIVIKDFSHSLLLFNSTHNNLSH